MLANPDKIEGDFEAYLQGFSSNVKNIIENFDFANTVKLMVKGCELFVTVQEFNPETYAIAKADMLIKGGNASSMKYGDTLSDDKFSGYEFGYIISVICSSVSMSILSSQNFRAVEQLTTHVGVDLLIV